MQVKKTRVFKSTPRCPKCKGEIESYYQDCKAFIKYPLEDNKFIKMHVKNNTDHLLTGNEPELEPTGVVFAECAVCGHIWKLNGKVTLKSLKTTHGLKRMY